MISGNQNPWKSGPQTTPRFKIKTCSTGQVAGFIVLYRRKVDGKTYPLHMDRGYVHLAVERRPATIFAARRNAAAAVALAKTTRQDWSGGEYTIQCVGNARVY